MGDDAPDTHRTPHLTRSQYLRWWLERWEVRAILVALLLGLGASLLEPMLQGRVGLMHPREVAALADAVERLEAGLGFRADDAPSRYRNTHLVGYLQVTDVTPGGAIAQAGIRLGDVIPSPYLDCFYKSLALGQGKSVGVTVLRGRERLTLRVQVPDLGLPARRVPWACPDSIVPGNTASEAPAKPRGWQ